MFRKKEKFPKISMVEHPQNVRFENFDFEGCFCLYFGMPFLQRYLVVGNVEDHPVLLVNEKLNEKLAEGNRLLKEFFIAFALFLHSQGSYTTILEVANSFEGDWIAFFNWLVERGYLQHDLEVEYDIFS